ncbi:MULTISPECIES: glycosyltransferase [unclassified Moorena]|uniref:glycosyltransferase n=1 Tax=unclassified Moorena TaxID=2683338 RepID=UPI0013B76DA3|nr:MULTISPECIES: glycosyltransferase [unclassified Moorena]NEP34199.1 glycosyltransferase family 4 protein [Moorena sp. SIO3B2]NEQ04539.1 glycosyltransferase family 4 protein [Moorena sp. SIO4E2]NEQ15525.1 glycosyltransferase family 4 protein [Moorena sp. SIO3E2]NES40112.1 glycosyltransferase family 4 protein [Moorena sp. SIO2C4]
MKTIALIEENWNGHRPIYLKVFTKTLLELGHQVIAFCPEPSELSEWVAFNCSKYQEQFQVFECQTPEPSSFPINGIRAALNAVKRWCYAKVSIQHASSKIGKVPDLVFFPWVDSCLAPYLLHHVVDRIFPYRWSGLYFHPRHLRLKQKFWSINRGPLKPHAVLKSSHCPAIAVLDEGIANKLQSKINGKNVITFPDFADESAPDFNWSIVKQIQAQADGKKIIGLLGVQSKRKGVLTLLEVAQQMVKEDYFFVFAGQLSKQTYTSQEQARLQTILNLKLPNCFFYFERIPDEAKFNALVSNCDILFAAYNNFPHSSNILTKAAVFEKPVIVSSNFCMAERVRKFKLGLSINEGDVLQCIYAIGRLCSQLEKYNQEVQPDFQGYRRLHSTDQLIEKLQTILNSI